MDLSRLSSDVSNKNWTNMKWCCSEFNHMTLYVCEREKEIASTKFIKRSAAAIGQ